MRGLFFALFCLFVVVPGATLAAQQKETVQGCAEWRLGGDVVVDGQRVRTNDRTRVTDKHPAAIELGDEVKAEGQRQPDGTILAAASPSQETGRP